MWTAGAMCYWGGVYVYTEPGVPDRNYYVGNKGDSYGNLYDTVGDFGANGNDKWNARFNVKVRSYFNPF